MGLRLARRPDRPRDLPLGVAGPATAVAQVEQRLAGRADAFEVHRYADGAAAREAVENRTVYGALVVTPGGTELLTASAASPVVAQTLQQAVAGQAAEGGAEVRTVDVVPAPASDPRGAVLNASVLPLALAGIATGALVTLLGLGGARAVAVVTGAAALVGVVAAAIAHSWLEATGDDWWAVAGVLGLSTLAVAGAVAGLGALLGRAGVGLGAALVMLLGNPFSARPRLRRCCPNRPARSASGCPGRGVQLLRSVSFFDGAAAGGPALTLAWWALLGLGAVLLGGALRNRARDAAATGGREPAPAG